MNPPIYTLTSITKDGRDSRCFGFYFSLEEAKLAADENRCSMSECYYHYLVIEEIGEGIHAGAEQVQWYKWSGGHELRGGEEGKWVKCEMPQNDRFIGTVNWNGIG